MISGLGDLTNIPKSARYLIHLRQLSTIYLTTNTLTLTNAEFGDYIQKGKTTNNGTHWFSPWIHDEALHMGRWFPKGWTHHHFQGLQKSWPCILMFQDVRSSQLCSFPLLPVAFPTQNSLQAEQGGKLPLFHVGSQGLQSPQLCSARTRLHSATNICSQCFLGTGNPQESFLIQQCNS